MELPDGWISPFPSSAGFVWDVAGDPNPDNGHGFGGGGYDASMTDQAIEWGMDPTIKLTSRFIKRYCVPSAGGGAVALLGSNAFARISGLCPAGMDLSALKAAIDGLGTVAT